MQVKAAFCEIVQISAGFAGLYPVMGHTQNQATRYKCYKCMRPGEGYFIKFSVHKKKWTQSDLSFCKNKGSKNLKLMEKGVNWIANEGKIDTKCLKSVK